MTYCAAMRLDSGLVFAADTRTNAGVDNVSQFRKLYQWCEPGDRVLTLLASGNLAVTQSVVSLRNGMIVYSDHAHHLTAVFARMLKSDFKALLDSIDGSVAR